MGIKIKDRLSWISHQKDLLEKERLAEIEASIVQVEDVGLKQLEAKGIAISRLIINESFTGTFGRPTLTLVQKQQQGIIPPLPSYSFSSGDVIGLWDMGGNHKGQIASGVLSKVTSTSVQVCINEDQSEMDLLVEDTMIRLHKLANDITYKRIKASLEDIGKLIAGHSSHLIEVLFEEDSLYTPLPQVPAKLLREDGKLDLINSSLDESQVEALKFALMQKDLAVIHGPPGTGKTTTLVEIILQHVKLGYKILASAPSNLAVDNLLERLVNHGIQIVRLGHPARATSKAQQCSLDARIRNSDDFSIIKDIHKDIKASLLSLNKARDKWSRARIQREVKDIRSELKKREMRLSKDILSRSQVVLTTLTSAGNAGPLKLLPKDHFDMTVIDECSQGMECACYLSVIKAPKLVIAGDHHQLPPTVLSTEASKEGLLISLMERIISTYKDEVTQMLKVQYRMNKNIMDWASERLYENQLTAHSSVCSHLLRDIKHVTPSEETENSMVFIDTAGCNFDEVSTDDLSKGNEGEAKIVAEYVKNLVELGVNQNDIAVISPYNLQVEFIRDLLRNRCLDVEVRSVDGFQGRESEAVIISLVRSNRHGDIGFLSEERRLNVAVTRARRHLMVIGDSDTVCRNTFILSLVDHITQRGAVRSAHEFNSDCGNYSCSTPIFKMPSLELLKLNKQNKKLDQWSKKRNEAHRPSEEETKKRRIEFEKQILEFMRCSDEKYLEFPSKLNSFERLLIHEIAEEKGLIHESQGEGEKRCIIVRKIMDKPSNSSHEPEEDTVKTTGENNLTGSNNESFSNQPSIKEKDLDLPRNEGKNEEDRQFLKLDFPVEKNPLPDKKKTKRVKTTGENDLTGSNNESFSNHPSIKEKDLDLPRNEGENVEGKQFLKLDFPVEKNPLPDKNKSKLLPKSKQDQEKGKQNSSQFVTSLASGESLPYQKMTQTKGSATSSENSHSIISAKKLCEICGVDVLIRNYDLHVLRCEKLKNAKQIKAEINKRKTEIRGVKKNRENTEEEDDFDIMKKFSQENNSCAFPRCKNPSIILLQLCCFCRNNFCLKHHQAEIHGCEVEARKDARTQFIQNSILTGGSGTQRKKTNAATRAHLQRKLEKKVQEMGDHRKRRTD